VKNFTTKITTVVLLLLIALTQGCYKQEGELTVTPPGGGNNDDLTLKEDVQVIDSTQIELVSDASELERGIYRFEVADGAPEIMEGDVIVGEQGLGFLRKVIEINESGNELTLVTRQATLEEVIAAGSFDLQLDLSGSTPYRSPALRYEIKDLVLYNGA